MKATNLYAFPLLLTASTTMLLLGFGGSNTSWAFDRYNGGCSICHGAFAGPISPKGTVFPGDDKHRMHRNSTYMATDCNLCHRGDDGNPRNPFTGSSDGTANNDGLGCTGCHEATGLRKHHVVSGAGNCYLCHDEATPPAETVKPPYYGTADTKVDHPENTALVTNTNENWSVGDFLGLDNDGNNLYDLADYAVGPFQLLDPIQEGNDVRVTWLTAGGRNDILQRADSPAGPFTDVAAAINIPGVGLVTTNYLISGGATNSTQFYRLRAVVP